jgi:hypothetical protein
LFTKAIDLEVIHERMDFESWDDMPTKHTKIELGTCPLKIGKFNYYVYNIRKNIIDGLDEWYPFFRQNERRFHDVSMIEHEVYERGESKNSEIMRANFFINHNASVYTRRVMMYIDWLGIIGGLKKLLDVIIIGVIFKGFSRFNALIEILFRTNNNSRGSLDGLDGNDDGILNQTEESKEFLAKYYDNMCKRLIMYFRYNISSTCRLR